MRILPIQKYQKILHEADVVHHLAGMTSVARTKDEVNELVDEEMNKVALKGTEIVLSEISENCKIIFPSTHVVFEGKNSLVRDIKEDYETFPVLPYAVSKTKMKNR
jgi:nucleoside-diphosphate-sugar epimerase